MKKFQKYIWIQLFLSLVLGSVAIWLITDLTGMWKGDSGRQETETQETAAENDLPEKPEQEMEEAGKRKENREQTEAGEADDTDLREELEKELEEARRIRERQERYAESRKRLWEQAQEESEAEEEESIPPTIMILSDLHYISDTMHDDGGAFQQMVAEDDGKLSPYSDDILDALLEEALEEMPSALVMAGDNTLDGERGNHERLAEKLAQLQEAGVQVLLIPGNHDIQNTNAAMYFGEEKEPTEYLYSAEDFLEIYHSFGYDQAFSCDPASLSYVYALDETHWMLMLDSCRYEDRNHVEGRIREETLLWMEEILIQARENGASVLPVAHHNLLSESRIYTTECVMENYEEVTALLEQYEIPLFISGHLHAQRIKKHKTEPGVPDDVYGLTEIVMAPFSIAPCQYGMLSWDEDGGMSFETTLLTERMDETGTFAQMAKELTKTVIRDQIRSKATSIPQYLQDEMGELYADIYYDYCAGNQTDWDEATSGRAYQLWQRFDSGSSYLVKMKAMTADTRESYHIWYYPAGDPGEDRGNR
ncbi:MAG: metallophosphoesterase [Clostridiales bacterium]|nr:metallophosphoesterase [Clostridiales bacterium]